MRQEFLPFARPDLDGSEARLLNEVLESGWLTTGKVTHELERAFAQRVGARHAVAVNSCTAALHLAVETVGLTGEDEVVTTPYTFAATAEVVRYFGAKPRFVDIDPSTFNIDPEAAAAVVNSRTRAIIPVHIGGHPAEMDPLDALATKHGLAVVEDAAHALPAAYRGTTVGSPRAGVEGLKHLVCFSFYATKTMTTGEGGMICTNDERLADRCRLMALHGISSNAWNRYAAEGSWYYEITAPGFKYNMTDLAAALGVAQLARLDTMRQRREAIAMRYNAAFKDLPQLELPTHRPWVQHAWHLYPVRLHLDTLTVDRARFIEELKRRNIGTSVHFIPLHLHPYYRQAYGLKPEDFPLATREYKREVSLPIYSAMTDGDVDDVIEAMAEIIEAVSA